MKIYPQKHIAELIYDKRRRVNPEVKLIECIGGWLVGTPEQLADKAMEDLHPAMMVNGGMEVTQESGKGVHTKMGYGEPVPVHQATTMAPVDYAKKVKIAVAVNFPKAVVTWEKDEANMKWHLLIAEGGVKTDLKLSVAQVQNLGINKLAEVIKDYVDDLKLAAKAKTKTFKLDSPTWAAAPKEFMDAVANAPEAEGKHFVECKVVSMGGQKPDEQFAIELEGKKITAGSVFNSYMLHKVQNPASKDMIQPNDPFYVTPKHVKFAAKLASKGAVYFGLYMDSKTPKYVSIKKLPYWNIVLDEYGYEWLIGVLDIATIHANKMLSLVPGLPYKPTPFDVSAEGWDVSHIGSDALEKTPTYAEIKQQMAASKAVYEELKLAPKYWKAPPGEEHKITFLDAPQAGDQWLGFHQKTWEVKYQDQTIIPLTVNELPDMTMEMEFPDLHWLYPQVQNGGAYGGVGQLLYVVTKIINGQTSSGIMYTVKEAGAKSLGPNVGCYVLKLGL